MSIFNINKFPVIIIANRRTGSTALANKIAKIYNITNFADGAYIEPHKRPKFLKHLWRDLYIQKINNVVVKVIADQLDKAYLYQYITDMDSFKIKLLRRNKVDQIASCYIASKRDLWHQKKNHIVDDSEILINSDEVKKCITRILRVDNEIAKLCYNFDLELYYEDLFFDDYDISDVKSTVPKNINDIKEAVRNMLQIGNNNV